MPADHDITFTEDGDGWDVAVCSCGWVGPPVPDKEIAADCWGDHLLAALPSDDTGDASDG